MSGGQPSPGPGGAPGASLIARVFGDGEPPAWWGLPVGRLGGCEIRVHLVTFVFVLSLLVYAVWTGPGLWFVGPGLVALALVVGLHEAARGHALVRWRRLRPVDLTIWPLGAVWRLHDENTARHERAAAGAGLAMLVVLAVLFGLGVWAFAGGGAALTFNPARPSGVFGPQFGGRSTARALVAVFVWQCYAVSLYALAANLIPMLPLDGAILLRGRGYGGVDRVALLGLAVAVVLVVGGLVIGQALVALLGVCGGVVCWSEWQSSRFAIDPAGADRWRAALDEADHSAEAPTPEHPMIDPEREHLERVLAKISEEGMHSLTRSEQKVLREATERLRRG